MCSSGVDTVMLMDSNKWLWLFRESSLYPPDKMLQIYRCTVCCSTGNRKLRRLLLNKSFNFISQGPIHALAFSPNGKFLASGATDGRVLLWDIGHGLMFAELKGHTDTIYSLKFSRDGEILASGGWFAMCLNTLNQLCNFKWPCFHVANLH